MKPQSNQVLTLLRRRGSQGLTQQDAIAAISCYRLAARIADLKADGFDIHTERVTREGVTFARYVLFERAEQLAVGW